MAKVTSKAAPVTTLAKAPATKEIAVKLTHSPVYPQAIAFRDRAVNIVIGSKESHEGALRESKEGKALRKTSVEFYRPSKQELDRVKKIVLDLERDELSIIDAGADKLESRIVEWVRLDDARVKAIEDAARVKAEAAAKADRERELKEQEAAAAKLEDESPNLSAGELWFVTKVVEQGIDLSSTSAVDLTAMGIICKQAGYVDPAKTVARFAKSEKIRTAIATTLEVNAKREQAAALREQPLTVTTDKVERNVAKVAGTRMTKHYSCGGVTDLAKLIAAYKAGELPDEAFEPNLVHLNRAAKDLTDKFELAYPGARLKVTEGVAS